jgi:hypothetical protein
VTTTATRADDNIDGTGTVAGAVQRSPEPGSRSLSANRSSCHRCTERGGALTASRSKVIPYVRSTDDVTDARAWCGPLSNGDPSPRRALRRE